MTTSPLRALWRVRSYVRDQRGRWVGMIAAGLGATLAAMVVPLVVMAVIDGPVAHHRAGEIVGLVGVVALLGLTDAGLIGVRRWIQSGAALTIEARMRDDLYAHLQALPPSFHDGWQSGQLLSRAVTDLATIRRFVSFGLVFLVVNTITFAAVIGLLIALDPLLGVVVGLALTPVIALSARFERQYTLVSRRLQDQTGDLTTVVEEAMTGVRVLKALGRGRQMAQRFRAGSETVYATSMQQVRLQAHFWSLLDLVPNLCLVVVLLVGGIAVAEGRLTLGGLVAFVALLYFLIWPVRSIGFILASAQEAATAAARVYEILDEPSAIVESAHPVPLVRVAGRLAFEGVHFRYPGAGEEVLRGVDLCLAPGETVAIVGATGSGKSTLAALVPRLADVSAGRVCVDGVDVRDAVLADLRRVVGVAFEEPVLFSVSVRENVTLGAPEASEAEIAGALELAQAQFVYDLPWGLDTRIGEQGMSLSGGQRQRLALARAVLGRPRILVLDDPLSALDVHTEALVEAALARVLERATALLVVHRPSTVALADRVALLSGGVITAVGTHHELLASNREYRDILSAAPVSARPASPA